MGAHVRQHPGRVSGDPHSCAGGADPNARHGPVTAAGKGVLMWWQEYFRINNNIPIPMISPHCEIEFGCGNADGDTPMLLSLEAVAAVASL